MLKLAGLSVLVSICLLLPVRADLTIVQKIEAGDQSGEMIIKIKGNKERIEESPQATTIVDGKTGEMIKLMNDRKAVVRISAEKMKAAAETISKFDGNKQAPEKPTLTPTGKKETINGYETEQYTYETPGFKATFWIAAKYPNAPAILKELQAPLSDAWKPANMKMPQYTDFPGLPIKTVISVGGNQVTTTLTSIKQDPLSDAEFAVPPDFKEVKVPDVAPEPASGLSPAAESSPKP